MKLQDPGMQFQIVKTALAVLLIGLLTSSCADRQHVPHENSIENSNFRGIKGEVYEAETGQGLAARILIRDTLGRVIDSYYDKSPGFFTEENGSFSKELNLGKYEMEVSHGIDRLSTKFSFEISETQGVEAKIYLESWFNFREEGWVNGDGHCHLYTEHKPDPEMAALVRRICMAQGVDFVCASQGWAGYNDSTWEEGYAQFSDDRFILYYGSEMPKYRTGHTWWLGQKSTHDYFSQSMDTTYENQYYQSHENTHWDFDNLSFPNIPDIEIVQRLKEKDHLVAIMPHPTSWWMQERGDIEKYTTNVVSYLSFGLLAGQIWDGLVVMGYNHDHIFYQNLWFNVLNQGYRMPALGELDGGLSQQDRFYYGSMRTYYKLDGDFTIQNVTEAVRKGRTFVTSGPIIQTNIDDRYEIGDVILAGSDNHQLNISALASGNSDDFLSYVIVYRNGEIHKLWDLRKEKPRKFDESINLKETEQAWYVVKAYGSKAVEDIASLDILSLCDKSEHGVFPDFSGDIHDVCITSPYYFRPMGVEDPDPMVSNIELKLIDPESGDFIEEAALEVLVNGETINRHQLEGGSLSFSMPIQGWIRIRVEGYPEIRRGLYLDYLPHLKLLEELASGDWRSTLEKGYLYTAGEVPWEAFNYEKTREILSNVNWEIEMKSNERDLRWESFDSLF